MPDDGFNNQEQGAGPEHHGPARPDCRGQHDWKDGREHRPDIGHKRRTMAMMPQLERWGRR